jgi:tetratricopeptide (TPR) repeat protein
VLTGAVLLSAPAAAQVRHRSLVVEDDFRLVLRDFADGSHSRAIERLIRLEAKTSLECLEAIELRNARLLAVRDPESVMVMAFLRLGYRQALYKSKEAHPGLYRFEVTAADSLRSLAEVYVAASNNREARSLTAGLYTYLAHGIGALRSVKRLEAARELLEEAVELDPRHPAALYSLTVTLELLGRPALALNHLETLLARTPDDLRFRVRRAALTVKAGRSEQGRRLWEELRAEGPPWARELATQELARLLADDDRGQDAAQLLRQGIDALGSEKLHLQLAALLDPEWDQSWAVLSDWLADAQPRPAPTGRWVYEDGATEEIEAVRIELGRAVAERSPALLAALMGVPVLEDHRRKNLSVCK